VLCLLVTCMSSAATFVFEMSLIDVVWPAYLPLRICCWKSRMMMRVKTVRKRENLTLGLTLLLLLKGYYLFAKIVERAGQAVPSGI